jgi:PPOX class probable F420-dependent enzyme
VTGAPTSAPTGEQRRRVTGASVGRLATVRPDGRPHLVVVTFAWLGGDTLVTAVDAKPKRSTDLQRLRNVEASPWASLLVDHYEDDWTRLWWVRLDCEAEVVRDEPRRSESVRPLVEKYAAYRSEPPAGPAIVLSVRACASWSASA